MNDATTKTVKAVRTDSAAAGVVELDLEFKGGWEYEERRWAQTPPMHRQGCAVGSFPFAIVIRGRVFLHNAVVRSTYIVPQGGAVRYGAGRNVARYEAVTEDAILQYATAEAYGYTARERAKGESIRRAFEAIVEAL